MKPCVGSPKSWKIMPCLVGIGIFARKIDFKTSVENSRA